MYHVMLPVPNTLFETIRSTAIPKKNTLEFKHLKTYINKYICKFKFIILNCIPSYK